MHVKLYNCYIEVTNINYPRKANNLAIKLVNKEIMKKTANEEISTLFDYPETKKPHQLRRSLKNHFINDLIDKKVDIFISHREYAA